MNFRWIAVPIVLAATAAAQTGSGPALGWTLGEDGRSIQRILGVPGAARLGQTIRLPDDLRSVRLNPGENFAVALAGSEGVPVLVNLEDPAQRTVLDHAMPGPDDAVWSSSGSALAIRYRDAGSVLVYRFAAGVLQFKNEVAAVADRIAISDDGLAVLAMTDAGLSLYKGGDASVLASVQVPSFTFLALTQIPALWMDGHLRIGDQTQDLTAGDGEGWLLSSATERRLVAVRSGTGEMMTFDAAGQLIQQTSEQIRCDCLVSGLEAFGRSGAVRLVTAGPGPLWVAETSRMFFVPREQ